MKSKARENLQAARLLAEKKLINAAVSRAYYSAYHAAWSLIEEMTGDKFKKEAPDGGLYFPHRGFRRTLEAVRGGGKDAEEEADALEYLYSKRVNADYDPEDLDGYDAEKCIERADRLVARLLN